MSNLIQACVLIKKVVISLHKVTEGLIGKDLIDYKEFHELYRQFSNPHNEWKYIFKLPNIKSLSDIYASLKLLEVSKNKELLKDINEQAKNFLNEISNVQKGTVVWDSNEIDEDEILKKFFYSYFESIDVSDNLNNLEERYKELENQRNDIENNYKKMIVSQNEANKIIKDLKSKNEAFNQLIDGQSNTEIKTLYEKIYIDEIKLADKYRNWALLIFAVIGAVLLLGFLNLSIQNWNHLRDSSYIHIPFGWGSLLKTLMLFSLTTPAWYLTRESSKHRKVAYKAKMLGTELASFPLYAREFKDEDRLELRKSLADRFFGQELYNDSSNLKNTNDVSIEQIKLISEANKVLAESLKMKQNLS